MSVGIKKDFELVLTKGDIIIDDCNVRLDVIDEFKNTNSQHLDYYHAKVLKFFQKIIMPSDNIQHYALSNILTLYFQYTSGYIFDIINTKEIKNSKRLMKQLDKTFIPQLGRIITNYKSRLQEFLDFANSKKK